MKPIRQLIEARKDVPDMLDLVDETPDQLTLSVEPSVVVAGLLVPLTGRDNRFSLVLNDELHQSISVIAFVRNQVLIPKPFP